MCSSSAARTLSPTPNAILLLTDRSERSTLKGTESKRKLEALRKLSGEVK
jgi:hypothetical protein